MGEIKARNGLKKGGREVRDGDSKEVFFLKGQMSQSEYVITIHSLFIPIHNPVRLRGYFMYRHV
jgi:hypothetical protein